MIREPTDEEIALFRRWAARCGRFTDAPAEDLRADFWQELAVQSMGRRLIFNPARLRELLDGKDGLP